MNSEDERHKPSRSGEDPKSPAAKPASTSLLENALNNPIRRQCGFNVLFADANKAPRRDWIKWQSQPQSDDDICSLFSTWKPGEATCWGFVCGFKSLETIDFDWAWVYRLWKQRFDDRADTHTLQTTNGGFRPHYQCEKPETVDKFKESLHVELKGPGRFVVYEGKASREDGSIGEYKVVNDKPIREDNSIIADTLAFLEQTHKRYHFLWWNCIRPHFSKKVLGEPPHNVRLYISDIMAYEGFSYDEIYNMFRDFSDFDHSESDRQIRYTLDRVKAGLKPPTCETLREGLGWKEEDCRGCLRKGLIKQEEGTSLGDYILKLKGFTVVAVDKSGEPLWSTKITSLTGLRTKRDLAKKLKLEEDVVDRAVAKFMVQVAEEPIPPKADGEPAPLELIEKTRALLRDPKLICRIVQALGSLGLVGETRNALSCFFDMLSAKTRNPINRRWTGRSGIGKTTIVVKVASLFPPEMIMMLSGATKKTLWYHPDVVEIDETTRELNLEGKILILLEESESHEFLDEIKPLLSHDKHELEYAFVEKADGVNVTHKMRLRGWPAYIGITTESELREEQQTRALLATPDRGREKWRAVIAADAEAAASLEQHPRDDLTLIIQEAIRQLKPYKVWIPWLPILAHLFPHEDAKSMREWGFLHSFLDSIAILHQQQLLKVVDGEERLAAPVSILEIASKIVENSLAETIFKLPRDVQEFIDYLDQQNEKEWTYKEMQREWGKCFGGSIPQTTLKRRYIEKLVDEGLLEIDDSKKPYKIKFLEKRSTNLTIFEKSLEIIRSGKIGTDLIQKTSSTTDNQAQQLSAVDADGKPILIDHLTTTLYSARVVDDVLKAISRRKEEEYAVSDSFSDLVKLVEAFPEEKPALLIHENVEKVLNSLVEALRGRGSAHISEVCQETGISELDVQAILQQLQREGKVIGVYPEWWKKV